MQISPMLPEPWAAPFDDEHYLFEPKLSGMRLIVSRSGIETRLMASGKQELTRQFPELHRIPAAGDIVLDGELCGIRSGDGTSVPSYVTERAGLSGRKRIKSAVQFRPVMFAAFDILFHNGRDLRSLSLMKRRSILESVLEGNEYFRHIPYMDGEGAAMYRLAESDRLDGIVAKRKSSLYVGRRSHDWLHIQAKTEEGGGDDAQQVS